MAKKLGEILLERELITTEQLEEATEIQCLYGGKLGTGLIELGAIDEDTLGLVLSKSFHLPYFKPVLLMEIPPDILALVPRQLALKHMVLPCKLQGKRLFLAMSDPNDLSAIDDLSFHLGYSIAPVVVPELRLALALNKYHKRKLSPRFINLGKQLMSGAAQARTDAEARKTEGDEPISGLQEFRENVLEKDAVQNIEDLDEVLDVEDILEVEEEETAENEFWPTLGDENNSAESPSDSEYHELTTLGETSAPVPEEGAAPESEPESEQETGPRAVQSFCEQLIKADDRDDIATCLIAYLAQEFSAGGILMVKGDQVMGWQATIGAQRVQDFDRFHVSLDQPSVLLTVAQSKTYYLGPIPETVQNIMLLDNFGSDLPETVLLVPLLLRGRLVSILYVQDDIAAISDKLAELQRLVDKSSMAFEMLVLKNKILMS
ncbi:MAG TPA: hypothetical protein VJ974_06815 [Geopsychrobacteraceae bacterium]|nr:hypothetical protein [Geopsychrobacteraceae bacterium]